MQQNKHLQLFLLATMLVLVGAGYISSPMALLAGFLIALLVGNAYKEQTKKAIQYLLKLAVIGLGFGISLEAAIATSIDGFLITLLSILLTLMLGLALIRLLGIDKKLGFLLTSGTSICGGSAIAAVAPIIRAENWSVTLAIGIVFLLNAIALLIFPPIGHFLDLTQEQFGLWCAIAIHDTSSVVGAALDYGDRALEIATTVKLARTLWIIPLSLFAAFLFKTEGQKIKFPIFIIGFIFAIFINTYALLPPSASSALFFLAKKCLLFTLCLVGMSISIQDLKSNGWRPVLFALFLWLFISVFSLLYIKVM